MTGEDAESSAAAGLTEEEKRRYEEERKAFDDCMKYNILYHLIRTSKGFVTPV